MSNRGASRRLRADGHQKDTGWSWVVMLAHFSVLLIMVGIQKSTGIFFVEIVHKFEVTASMASLVTGMSAACASITVIFVMTCIVNIISERQCLLIGATIMTGSMIWSSFATSFPVLVFALGALQGVGSSFIYGPSFVVLGKYFSRHLTSAQAFATCGVSVGGAIVPIIIRAAIDEFSFPAGMLVVGGLQANIFIGAFLLRPAPQPAARVDAARDEESGEASPRGYLETRRSGDCDGKITAATDGTRSWENAPRCNDARHEAELSHDEDRRGTKTGPRLNGNGDAACRLLLLPSGKSEDAPSESGTKSDCKGNKLSGQSPHHVLSSDWALASQKSGSTLGYNIKGLLYIDDAAETHDMIRKRLLAVGTGRPRSASETAKADNEPTMTARSSNNNHNHNNNNPLISSLQSLGPRKRRYLQASLFSDHDGDDNEEDLARYGRSALDRLSSSSVITSLSSIPGALYISLRGLGTSQRSLAAHSARSDSGLSVDTGSIVGGGGGDDEPAADERRYREDDSSSNEASSAIGAKRGCKEKFDLSVCRTGAFWGVVLIQAFGFPAGALGPAFLPPLAEEKGLTDEEAALLLTLISSLDILSRLLPGVIAHYKWMKPATMVSLSLFVMGALCQTTGLLDTYTGMVGFCVLYGLFSGVFFAMSPAVIIEFTGLERFAAAFGFIQLFLGISAASVNVVLGSLKDLTGTYDTSFQFLGATAFFSATLLAVLAYLKRKRQGSDKEARPASQFPDQEIQILPNGVDTNDLYKSVDNNS